MGLRAGLLDFDLHPGRACSAVPGHVATADLRPDATEHQRPFRGMQGLVAGLKGVRPGRKLQPRSGRKRLSGRQRLDLRMDAHTGSRRYQRLRGVIDEQLQIGDSLA